jgi:hypothetical protein
MALQDIGSDKRSLSSTASLPRRRSNYHTKFSHTHSAFKACGSCEFILWLGLPICFPQVSLLTLCLWFQLPFPSERASTGGTLFPTFCCITFWFLHAFHVSCHLSWFLMFFLSFSLWNIFSPCYSDSSHSQSHMEKAFNPPSCPISP